MNCNKKHRLASISVGLRSLTGLARNGTCSLVSISVCCGFLTRQPVSECPLSHHGVRACPGPGRSSGFFIGSGLFLGAGAGRSSDFCLSVRS